MKDKNTGALLNFFMEDKNFLLKYLSGGYPLKKTQDNDVMIVLVEYKNKIENGIEKIDRRNAIKVYQINDEIIENLPKDQSIESVMLSVEKLRNGASENQDTLFDLFNNE